MSGKTKRFFKCSQENSVIEFTEEQKNIFDGIMISDGGIPKDMYTFVVTQKTERIDYLYYICDLLNIDKTRVNSLIRKPDKRTGKCYNTSYIRTLSDWYFKEQRERWYPEGKKIVPKDIKLTREMLTQWFMGDGSAGIYAHTTNVCLCTNSFSKEDLDFLIEKLKELNIESRANKQSILVISKKSHKTFFEHLGICPIDCFKYKWIFN